MRPNGAGTSAWLLYLFGTLQLVHERRLAVALHLLVARLAGNRATMRVVGDLHRRTSIFDHGLVPDRFAAACAQHLHILDAIAQSDAADSQAQSHG